MSPGERSVLHVLPHPGGGGETYVDLLEAMPGYRFSRVYLAPSPAPSVDLGPGVVRSLVRSRKHQLVHLHGEVASGLCLALLATRPSVVTLNGLHLLRRTSGLRRRAAVLNLRAVVRAADRTICVSQAEHDYLAAAVGSAAERRAVVVHNGVAIPPSGTAAREDVRAELGLSSAEPVGIWVGGLDDHKDPLTAVRAARAASITLLVVGDGPLRDEVEHAAAGGPARVLGRRSDVPRLLSAADFFVLTSRREGLSFALLEAMSCGLPAVVSETAENVEAVGDSGIAVPLGDQHALAATLARLAATADDRHTLGRRARERVAEHFDAEEMVRRTRSVYDETAGERTLLES